MAALLGTLPVFGCGSEPRTAAPPADERPGSGNQLDGAEAETVRLALLEPSEDSDAAGLDGYLHVEGRCLYVTGPGGSGARTLPAFTIAGARWDAERGQLLAHGKSFHVGQRVTRGGSSATNPDMLRWVQAPDPTCDSRSIFVTGMIDAALEPARR